jgi:hypothetical protein
VGGACGTHGGGERCLNFFFFVERPGGKRPLGRPRRRWGIKLRSALRR